MTAAHEEPRDWRRDGLCTQVDPDLFFPDDERGAKFEAQAVAAKRICAGCPVRERCLDYALRALSHGVAGGTTPAERVVLRRVFDLGECDSVPLGLVPIDGVRTRAAAGRSAAASGLSAAELARKFRVSRGTAQRWHADARRTDQSGQRRPAPDAGEGSPAATGTPLRISTAREALAGNTAPEGNRS